METSDSYSESEMRSSYSYSESDEDGDEISIDPTSEEQRKDSRMFQVNRGTGLGFVLRS